MILAIETATDICSVALQNDEGEIFEKRTEARGSHSEKLFGFIRELMEEHQFKIEDLSAILISEGPGSYTGLRIAASGVKGLLFGSDVPLYGVSTLASFAIAALAQHQNAQRIHAVIDAKRVHLYHQLFEVNNQQVQVATAVDVIPIESVEQMIQPNDIIIGTGLERLDESIIQKARYLDSRLISAESLFSFYQQSESPAFIKEISPEQFDPKYYSSGQV